jgi:hypothetical protein
MVCRLRNGFSCLKSREPAMLPIIARESTEYVIELSKSVSYCTERPLVSLDQHLETHKYQWRAWDFGLKKFIAIKRSWRWKRSPGAAHSSESIGGRP